MLKISNSHILTKLKLKLWQNSKTQIVTILKNSRSDKTQSETKLKLKLKLWQISNTQIVTKLKFSNCEKTQNFIVKKLQKLNCDKTQTLKLWQNWTTQTARNLTLKLWQILYTQILTKLKLLQLKNLKLWQYSNCDTNPIVTKFKCWKNFKKKLIVKKTQKGKFWQNSIYDKTQLVTKLNWWQNLVFQWELLDKTESFSVNFLTLWQPMRCFLGTFCNLAMFITVFLSLNFFAHF